MAHLSEIGFGSLMAHVRKANQKHYSSESIVVVAKRYYDRKMVAHLELYIVNRCELHLMFDRKRCEAISRRIELHHSENL